MGTFKYNGYTVKIHEPLIVAQSTELYERDKIPWGSYQFSEVRHSGDGMIEVSVHIGNDSIAPDEYIKTRFISNDNGASFYEFPVADPYKTPDGLICINGDGVFSDGTIFNSVLRHPVEMTEIGLPETPFYIGSMDWHKDVKHYLLDQLEGYDRRYCFNIGGENKFCDVGMPENTLAYDVSGRGRWISMPGYYDPHVDENDVGWGVGYGCFYDEELKRPCFHPFFLISEDHGKTFKYRSGIPYRPDPSADPEHYAMRDGFTEPTIGFLPNGNVMCLMRTEQDKLNGPMYYSVSSDRGYTWSHPKVFSSFGVRPRMLTLGCGVILASYGRPGVCVRTTADRDGIVWNDEIAIVDHEYTCGYTGMISLSDTEALLIYSDCIYPDSSGVERKTVLARKIEIIMD